MANEQPGRIQVEVVYAHTDRIWRRQLDLPAGSTALYAVQASGVLQAYPELENTELKMGVFGRLCVAHQILQPGDRVEIYRPLVFDPMESRRRRQKHRQRQAQAGKEPLKNIQQGR